MAFLKNIYPGILAVILPLLVAAWTGLNFPPQYDEEAHRSFSKFIAEHPTWHTILTYEGSQNYEAKAPLLFIISAVFGRLVGFQLYALRILTLCFSLASIYAFSRLLRLFQAEQSGMRASVFQCLPYYLILSVTFMTDVPCVALLLFAIFGYLSHLDSNKISHLVIGIVASSAVSYVRVDYLFPLIAIAFICWRHDLLSRKLIIGLALPFVLRLPLLLVWGGFAAPPAQTRPHAVGVGFQGSHLVFALAVIGLYFWPFIWEQIHWKRRQTLPLAATATLLSAVLVFFWTPQILRNDVDRYAGTLRSLMIMMNNTHLQQCLWWALATLGIFISITLLVPVVKSDPKLLCIQASCVIGLLMQAFRGNVIYERYLLEISVFYLLVFAILVKSNFNLLLWSLWCCTLQFTQLFKNGLLP